MTEVTKIRRNDPSELAELISALKALESDQYKNLIELDAEEGIYIMEPSDSDSLLYDIYSTISILSDRVLITHNGRPAFDAMTAMRKHGFRVGPGEQDSFGWVTGVIYTKVGNIVF